MIGARLGGWILDSELGRGGMARVFLAHAEGAPTSLAAVKVLPAELAVDTAFPARFQREIDILRQLDHPNIVRFLESGVHEGCSFFAMEYIDGPNVETLLQEQGRLPWPEVLDLAMQIAPALKHAHDRGIIHRDLKPANLLIALRHFASPGSLGQVKLTDFGVASLFAGTHLTKTGNVVGTAEYLSPEQALGKPVTRRSDLYSLGAVLYRLLTGRTPFEGTVVDLLHKHVYAQFERPMRLAPDIPLDLDALIVQMLDKDPARRPADGAILHRRLDSIRRKMDRLTEPPPGYTPLPATLSKEAVAEAGARVGPATLMSRLMRTELESQKRGGPVQQFFNKPWVVVPLFLLTLSGILWAFWPPSMESQYRRGAALMASPNADDWETAWTDYLEPLEKKHPDNAHKDEINRFYQQLEAYRAGRDAWRKARRSGPMTEAQWFYQEGLRQRQQGNEKAARKTWDLLVKAFQQVPSEAAWVKLAQERLEEEHTVDRQLGPVHAALATARELRDKGEKARADAIVQALKELYRDDPKVQAILKGE